MILIDNKVVSLDLIEKEFICNLDACKGACCWEGDYGAPLSSEETVILGEIYSIVAPYLTDAGRKAIQQQGTSVYNDEVNEFSTPLIQNAACAYIAYSENGIAQCGIEQAHQAGKIDFKKPISCHLYPIRIKSYENFDAVNYDKWDICDAACSLGKKEQVPIYRFVKEALIRKYGATFYDELEVIAQDYLAQNKK